jgi:hypothetical protein
LKTATSDRSEIIHFAGFHRLSPALRDGAPAFAAGQDASLRRCGWEAFFDALEARGLVLTFDPEDAGTAAFVPRHQAEGLRHRGASLRAALEHSARFLRALLSNRHAAR